MADNALSPSSFAGQSWACWAGEIDDEGKGPDQVMQFSRKNEHYSQLRKKWVMCLPWKDMKLFGFNPVCDETLLVKCETCQQVFRSEALPKHAEIQHGADFRHDSPDSQFFVSLKKPPTKDMKTVQKSTHSPTITPHPPHIAKLPIVKIQRHPIRKMTPGAEVKNVDLSSPSSGKVDLHRSQSPELLETRIADLRGEKHGQRKPPSCMSISKVTSPVSATTERIHGTDGLIQSQEVEWTSSKSTQLDDFMMDESHSHGEEDSLSSRLLSAPSSAGNVKSSPPMSSQVNRESQQKLNVNKYTNFLQNRKPTLDQKKQTVKSAKSIPCRDRKYDADIHCGVWYPATQKHCTRSLTCKFHSLSARRAVNGRTKVFDQLLADHRAKHQGKESSKKPSSSNSAYIINYNNIDNNSKQGGEHKKHSSGSGSSSSNYFTANISKHTTPVSTTTHNKHIGANSQRCSKSAGVVGMAHSNSDCVSPLNKDTTMNHRCSATTNTGASDNEMNDDLPDMTLGCHFTYHHPKPSAMCSFGARTMNRGVNVFNRSSDLLRQAFLPLVDKTVPQPPAVRRTLSAPPTASVLCQMLAGSSEPPSPLEITHSPLKRKSSLDTSSQPEIPSKSQKTSLTGALFSLAGGNILLSQQQQKSSRETDPTSITSTIGYKRVRSFLDEATDQLKIVQASSGASNVGTLSNTGPILNQAMSIQQQLHQQQQQQQLQHQHNITIDNQKKISLPIGVSLAPTSDTGTSFVGVKVPMGFETSSAPSVNALTNQNFNLKDFSIVVTNIDQNVRCPPNGQLLTLPVSGSLNSVKPDRPNICIPVSNISVQSATMKHQPFYTPSTGASEHSLTRTSTPNNIAVQRCLTSAAVQPMKTLTTMPPTNKQAAAKSQAILSALSYPAPSIGDQSGANVLLTCTAVGSGSVTGPTVTVATPLQTHLRGSLHNPSTEDTTHTNNSDSSVDMASDSLTLLPNGVTPPPNINIKNYPNLAELQRKVAHRSSVEVSKQQQQQQQQQLQINSSSTQPSTIIVNNTASATTSKDMQSQLNSIIMSTIADQSMPMCSTALVDQSGPPLNQKQEFTQHILQQKHQIPPNINIAHLKGKLLAPHNTVFVSSAAGTSSPPVVGSIGTTGATLNTINFNQTLSLDLTPSIATIRNCLPGQMSTATTTQAATKYTSTPIVSGGNASQTRKQPTPFSTHTSNISPQRFLMQCDQVTTLPQQHGRHLGQSVANDNSTTS